MAAFRDDMPLEVGVNEDWDENTTRAQIVRPDWDFSPIRMKTMHHLLTSSLIRCAQRDLIVRSWYLVVSQFRATKSLPRTFTVMNHAVYQQATLCQPKKRRYA